MLLAMIGLGAFQAYVRTFATQQAAADELAALGAEIQYRRSDLSFISELIGGEPLQHVVSVKLEHRKFSDDDLKPLVDLPQLERLYLASTPVTDDGLQYVKGLKRLRRMSLWRTRITQTGLEHLANLKRLEVLDIHGTTLSESALEIFRDHPRLQKLIHSIVVSDLGLDALASVPNLKVEGLSCRGVSDRGLHQAANFNGLRHLAIDSKLVTDIGIAKLSNLKKLEGLSLRGVSATDRGIANLANASSLQSLTIDHTSIHGRSLIELQQPSLIQISLAETSVRFETLASLLGPTTTILRIDHYGFYIYDGKRAVTVTANATMDDLKNVRHFTVLERLTLAGNSFHLAQAPFLKDIGSLEYLGIECPCDDADAKVIGSLPNLKWLSLKGPQSLTPGGFACIGQLRDLTTLDLSGSGLTDADSEFLTQLSNLELLELPGNPISSASLLHIAHCEKLARLNVSFCPKIDDDAFELIAGLKSLADLSAQETQVTDAGVAHLFGHPRLHSMTVLGSQVTPECLRGLRKSLPLQGGVIY